MENPSQSLPVYYLSDVLAAGAQGLGKGTRNDWAETPCKCGRLVFKGHDHPGECCLCYDNRVTPNSISSMAIRSTAPFPDLEKINELGQIGL